ncbi:hypothetical protein Tco_0156420 [Tanacetum coccineum]
MAKGNVPAPTRTDDQLVPVKARLPIGKSNLLMDLQKKQKNPIFLISLDILQNTNFFDAFTASANVPSIYIHALGITPKDLAHPFVAPPPWRSILSMIKQCLTGKTSGSDRPRHPVLQMLWGVVTGTNVDFAELIWDEFIQAIKTFFTDVANLKVPSKKPKPHKYLEMAARKPRQPTAVTDEESMKKKKVPLTDKSKKAAPPNKRSLFDRLVDEEDEEPQPAPEPQIEDDEYNLQRGIQMSLESFQAPVGGVAIHEPTLGPKKKSTTDQYIFQRRTLVTEEASTRPYAQPQDDTSANVVRDTPSPAYAETGGDTEKSNSEGDTEILNVDEERDENISNTVALEERTVELDEGQAGSDPGNTLESRSPPDEDQVGSNPGQSHVALAGPNPEPMHEDFIATVYPKVHESLKHITEEHSLYDKPTEEEPGKANVETKVESMVTAPIHQASSTIPPLFTLVIDLTPPKPVSPPIQELIFIAITATTTTTLLPPPPPQQQLNIVLELATRVFALEKICDNFEKKHKLQDKTTQAPSSRVFTLENHDLYSKIDNYVNETVKKVVQNALQAPVHERFRELS